MIQELRISRLALINELHLDFSDHGSGLLVLTGETGAGKSIILQAIHLLLGGRASGAWIRNGCEQAVIEAYFAIPSASVDALALVEEHSLANPHGEEHDPDHQSGCLVRRVLSQRGRSKIYVNDQLVTARLAGELTTQLVTIASQHDHQRLLNPVSHLDFLDTFGELDGLREQFAESFRAWKKSASVLQELMEQEQEKEQRRDFLQFQLDEITAIAPEADEDDQLIQEREKMKSSTILAELVGKSYRHLSGDVLDALLEVRKNMEQCAELDPEVRSLADRIVSACFEIEDFQGSLREYRDSIPLDNSRLEEIANRLAALRQLQRKYGPTQADVLTHVEQIRQELEELELLDVRIARLEKELSVLAEEALRQGKHLRVQRKTAAQHMATAIAQELQSLQFNQTSFEVAFSPATSDTHTEEAGQNELLRRATSKGLDTVEFLFSANPGEPPKPLAQVVSGGELSRFMLAMKCILARRDLVETVIFDEVDAGISGEAAEAVARKIHEVAGHHQVFCITHLPQIAARANAHFKVEKLVEEGKTRTVIRPLSPEERVTELARMLGGEHPTEQTMAYAQELLTLRNNQQ